MILIIFLIPITKPSIYADEITDQQVYNYWNSLTEQEKVDFIRDGILRQNAEPEVTPPDYFYIIANNQLTIFSNPKYFNIKIHDLEYNISFPTIDFKYKEEYEFPVLETVIAAGLGVALGLLLRR